MSSSGLEEDVPQIGFARFAPGPGQDLVFTTYSNGGAGSGSGELVVVEVTKGIANATYFWQGRGGVRFHVTGSGPRQQLRVTAQYWTDADADCCPVRSYSFTLASLRGYLQAESDERPFLGVYLNLRPSAAHPLQSPPARVVGIVPHSPAAGVIRPGDVLLSVVGSTVKTQTLLGPAVIDEVSALDPGTKVTLRIRRGAHVLSVGVKLTSILSQAAQQATPPTSYSTAVL